MSLDTVLAQATVTDLEVARRWWSTLMDRDPDALPMPGLLEWRLPGGSGVQVWSEPDRAGRGTVVLHDTDLDATAARLASAGLTDGDVGDVSAGRALQLADPDGNRVVLVGY